VDAVVTDPPYGMDWHCENVRWKGGSPESQQRRKSYKPRVYDKVIGDDEPFDPSPFLDYPSVVLFGYNHFAQRLPVGTLLVWLKRLDAGFGSFLSDAEVAWMKGGHGVYCKRDLSMNGEALTRQHPTQKPVPIMAWCMEMASVAHGATVCDPFMGSGTTGIACLRTGRRFVGIEISPEYYAIARKRVERELSQLTLPLAPELRAQQQVLVLGCSSSEC
jgi:hypothetical protein